MNADPRRPDKVQRYVAKNNSNAEDLTPDYMNIMGQQPTTANAAGEVIEKQPDPPTTGEPNLQVRPTALEEVQSLNNELVASNAANVIPTSPQYGVAIISSNVTVPAVHDFPAETVSLPIETSVDTTAKADDTKDIHPAPSRNDRFKVVKIASLEPFKRGRWKCMDYVDEAPPPSVVNNTTNKTPQSTGNAGVSGGVYLHSQSLPPQQIQQMLIQGGFTNGTQFFPTVPAQLLPQAQYFYPQVGNMQNQTIPQPVASTMPAQFINNQTYFPTGVVTNPAGFALPQSYPNIQYVPIPTQGGAFVPTSQTVQLPTNFPQSQTFGGQASVSQANIVQPIVNGHNYTQQSDQQMTSQAVKNVVVNSIPSSQSQQQPAVQNQPSQSLIQGQQYQSQSGTYQQGASLPNPLTQTQPTSQTLVTSVTTTPTVIAAPVIAVPQQIQPNNDANNVYTNPQFAMSVNSLTVLGNSENPLDANEPNSVAETVGDGTEDPSKSNPVVNAIDNKIEQAMDLVKSHLMYTVREEVEVLKEKIAELMEKIQQLETENNYLRSLIPKNQSITSTTTTTTTYTNPVTQPQPSNVSAVPSNPNVITQNSNPVAGNTNPSPGVSITSLPPSQTASIPNNSTIPPTQKETSGNE
ncbi:TSC22 domain family protein 1-like [Cylas formicarius]|uniref:TSC22 domain family protein 1-like n=1 Tax=Cylas formicarius TaxID=197179 RepID=UPI002958322D|nr:TSC22 domain family protein 1-like [Cylas formicarius]XP_060525299.1 TSC22 domain family protein 1-like [Cylas formicarius]XP_060525306.1 TSC22 domain family protein 1-like [Cylas formicarius]